MKIVLICVTVCSILCSHNAFSQDISQTAGDDIHVCGADAAAQDLRGDARKNFVVKCLTDRAASRSLSTKSPARTAMDRCKRSKSECISAAGMEYGESLLAPTKSSKAGVPRISSAKAAIKNALNDPASAQFKDLTYVVQSGAVCGQFNGKNGMGGYVPFQLFAYSANGALIIVEDASRVYGVDDVAKLDKLGEIVFNSAAANALCVTPLQNQR